MFQAGFKRNSVPVQKLNFFENTFQVQQQQQKKKNSKNMIIAHFIKISWFKLVQLLRCAAILKPIFIFLIQWTRLHEIYTVQKDKGTT